MERLLIMRGIPLEVWRDATLPPVASYPSVRFFCPAAFGLPKRGDAAFAARTRSSSSTFGTFRSSFMMPVNRANSGLALNRAALRGWRVFPSLRVSDDWSCRPSAMRHLSFFPGQLPVCDPTSQTLAHPNNEAVDIVRVPIVEPKRLLINVTEQVEWLDSNVSTMQGSLQERPEVLNPVGVDLAINISLCMGDHLMPILIKAIIGFQFITVNRCAGFHVF